MTYATNPQRLAFISNNLAYITSQLRNRDEPDGLPGIVPRPLQGRQFNYRNTFGDWASIHVTHLSTDSLVPWVAGTRFDVSDLFPYVDGELYHVIKPHTSTTLQEDIDAGNLEKVSGFDADMGEWQPRFSFEKGALVEFNGQLIQANTAHQSSDAFLQDTANWRFIANTKVTTTLTGPDLFSYKGHAVDDGGKVWFCITPQEATTWQTQNWGGLTNVALAAPVADFVGATGTSPGVSGLVPAPLAGQQNGFLSARGSFVEIPTYVISTGRLIRASTVLQASDLNNLVMLDSSSSSFNLGLTNNPSVNDTFYLVDAGQRFDTHPVTLTTNKYFGVNQTFSLTAKGGQYQVTYRGNSIGWTVVPTFGTQAVDLNPYSVATGRLINSAQTLAALTDLNKTTLVDTSGGSFTLDLPSNPQLDDVYYLQDSSNSFAVHPLSINTATFYGQNRSIVLNHAGLTVALTYRGGVTGWVLTPLVADPGSIHVAPITLTGRTVTADTTLLSTDLHMAVGANSAAGSFNIFMPSNPAVDDEYAIYDPVSSWGTKPVSVYADQFFGQTGPWVLNTAGGYFIFTYRGPTIGWTVRASDPINYATITRGMISTGRLISTNTQLSALTDLNKVTMIDTVAGPISLAMPDNPAIDDLYYLIDAGFDWTQHPVTLANNTYFSHVNTTQLLDMSGATVALVYRGGNVGWTIGSIDALADTGPLMAVLSLKADATVLAAETTARIAADAALRTDLTALQQSLATAGDVHLSDLQAETAARIAADTTIINTHNTDTAALNTLATGLRADLTAETAARTTADSTLQTAFNQALAALTDTVATLQTALTAETANRTSADTTLNTSVTASLTTLTTQLHDLSLAIDAEVSARTSALSGLSAALSLESNTRVQSDNLINLALAGESTARVEGDNANAAAIAAEVTNRAAAVAGFQSDLTAEITARTAADAGFATGLSNETSARQAADTANTTAITAETTARTAAVAAVSDALTAEITTRSTLTTQLQNEIDAINTTLATIAGGGTVDGALLTALTTRVATVEGLVATLRTDLTAETAARVAADTANADAIAAETAARTLAVSTLSAGLSSEITARQAVAAALDTETTNRTSADATLQGNIDAEAATRALADNANAAAITAETTARTADVATLTAADTAEANARALADATNATAISDEVTARTAAITAVNTALAAETTARTAADTAISTALATETANRADADLVNSNAISAETAARTAAVATVADGLAAEVLARTGDITAANQAISQEVADRAAAVSGLQASTNTAITAINTSISAIQTAATAEAATRATADTAIAGDLAAEIATRSTLTTGLRTDLNAETAARADADTALGLRIDSEFTDRTAADTALAAADATETAARIAGDAANAAAISTEAGARASAITALQTTLSADIAALALFPDAITAALNTEITDRTAADTTLQNNINAEAATRATADTANATAIAAETSNRQGADAAIQLALDNEITTRLGLTDGLRADLTTETNTRATAVATLTTALNNEIASRTALTDALASADSAEAFTRASADTALQTNITAETAARIAADTALQGNIDTEVAARAAAITAEETARTTADTNLQNQITALALYAKTYAVAVGASVNVEVSAGNTALSTNMVYRLRLVVTSTSALTGSCYIAYYSGGAWTAKVVTTNTTAGGNFPQLKVTGTNLQVFHNHATTSYNIKVVVEAFDTTNSTAASPNLYGMDGVASYDGNGSLVTFPNVSVSALTYGATLTGGTGVVNLGSGQFYKDASGQFGFGTSTVSGLITTKVAINTVNQFTAQADNGTVSTKLAAFTLNRFNYDASGTAAEIAFWRGANAQDGEITFATNPGGTASVAATVRVRLTNAGALRPETNAGADLGTTSFRWNNLYLGNIDYSGTLTGGAGVITIGSTQLYKDASGNFTLGSTSLYSQLGVEGAGTAATGGAQKFLLSLVDSSAVAAGVGGGLVFFGNYTGTTKTGFAGIQGIKENATAGNTAGALILTVRANGANLAEALRITSAGVVQPATNAAQDFGTSALRWNNQYVVNIDYSGTLTGGTGAWAIGTNQLVKDASGQFVFGGTTPITTDFSASAVSVVQVQGTNDSNASAGIVRYSADANGPHLYFGKSRGAAVGTGALVTAGDSLGEVGFLGHDGSTGLRQGAFIRAVAEQTPAAGSVPAGLAIGVTYSGSATWAEAWRFDSLGRLNSQQATARAVDVAGAGTAGATSLINLETVRSNTWSGITMVTHSTTATLGPSVVFARTRGAAVGDNTVVQNGDSLGGMSWAGADGTSVRAPAAEITAAVDGTPATGSIPGRLYVATTAAAGASPTKRAYWDAVGDYYPNVTGTYNQGSVANRWKGLYANTIDLSGNAVIGGTLNVTGAVTLTAGLPISQVKDQAGNLLIDDNVKNNLLAAPRWGSYTDGWNPYGIQGVNSAPYALMPNGEYSLVWQADSTIGNLNWFGGPISNNITINNDRTYRLVLPFRRISSNTDGHLVYIGASAAAGIVDNLNTTTNNTNLYFYSSQISALTLNKWYLLVVHVYPTGVSGFSNAAIVFDMDTGDRVSIGQSGSPTDCNWNTAATTFRLRAGLYKASAATQVTSIQFGKPRFEVMDGGESDYTSLFGNNGMGLGNPLGLVGTNVTIRGNKIQKTGGTNAVWDAGAYSRVGYAGGCYLRFRVTAIGISIIAGLNVDPTTDDNYTSIDYAFYIAGSSTLNVRESGTAVNAVGTVAIDDILSITYDGSAIRYYVNGVVVRTVNATITASMYFDCSIYSLNAGVIEDVEFGPMSTNNFSLMYGTPTTVQGYGITNAVRNDVNNNNINATTAGTTSLTVTNPDTGTASDVQLVLSNGVNTASIALRSSTYTGWQNVLLVSSPTSIAFLTAGTTRMQLTNSSLAMSVPILAQVGSVYTTLASMPATTANIRQNGDVNAGTGGYVPLLGQTTLVTGGYRMHTVLGTYRDGTASYGGGFFIALGGNDNNPTTNYMFTVGGVLSHTSGTIGVSSSLSLTGGLVSDTKAWTVGTNQLVKDVNGNFGFGTATPGSKVHLYASAASTQYMLTLENDSSAAGGTTDVGIVFKTHNGTSSVAQGYLFQTNSLWTASAYGANAMVLTATGPGGLALMGEHASGNVRIYAGTPAASGLVATAASTGLTVSNAKDFTAANLNYFYKQYSVAPATNVVVSLSNASTTLTAGNAYRVRLVTTGTSSNSGSVYLVTNTSGTWSVQAVSINTAAGANFPQVSVSGTTLNLFHNHASLSYTVTVFVETIVHGNTTTAIANLWGADSFFTHEQSTNALTLTPGTVTVTALNANTLFVNSTAFAVDSSSNVSVGRNSSLGAKLTVVGATTSGTVADIASFTSGNTGNPVTGDGARIYLAAGTNLLRSASIEAVVSNGINGHHISLSPNQAGAGPAERFRVDYTATAILGNGDTDAAPLSATIRGTDAVGTNIAAASLTIRSGRPTGSGAGSTITLQTASTGTTGATLGTLNTGLVQDQYGRLGVAQAPNTGWYNFANLIDFRGGRGAVGIASGGSVDATFLSANAVAATNDLGTTAWNYANTGSAEKLELRGGFRFDYAASGTGGTAITWTNLGTWLSTGFTINVPVLPTKLGIGTTSPVVDIQLGGGSTYRELRLLRNVAGSNAQAITFLKSRGTTEAAPAAVVAGDTLGSILWSAHDGTSYVSSSGIVGYVQNNPTTGVVGGALSFNLQNNTGGGLSTQMTLTPGQLSVNGTVVANTTTVGNRSSNYQAPGNLFTLPGADDDLQYVGASFEVVTVTAVADVAGSLAGKYFRLYGMGGTSTAQDPTAAEQIIDVWFQVSGSGTQPVSGAGRWVQVNITTGATAAAVASAVATTMATDAAFKSVATDGAGVVVFCHKTPQNHTAATAGTSGFTVSATADGSGVISTAGAYAGAVLAGNGLIYCVPYNATAVMVIDPDTNVITTFGSIAGTSKYVGGVLARDGKIYCISATAGNILVIDPSTNTTTTIGSGLGQYRGGSLAPNGKIYAVPYVTGSILVIDPVTQTTSTFGTGISGYMGSVLALDGKIYAIPADATTVLVVDPATNTYTTFGAPGAGTLKYFTGTLAPNGLIYCPPYNATNFLIIDPINRTLATAGTFTANGTRYYSSCLGANGKVYCMPFGATGVLEIDPNSNATSVVGSINGTVKYIGSILAPNGKVYGIPYSAKSVLSIGTGTSPPPAWYLSAYFNKF